VSAEKGSENVTVGGIAHGVGRVRLRREHAPRSRRLRESHRQLMTGAERATTRRWVGLKLDGTAEPSGGWLTDDRGTSRHGPALAD